MLYLLLAPLPQLGEAATGQGDRVAARPEAEAQSAAREQAAGTVFESRRSDRTQILVQQWEDLEAGRHHTGERTGLDFAVEQIALCRVAGMAIGAMEVRASGRWRSRGGGSIAELEADLTSCARAEFAGHSETGQVPWVGRFALLEGRKTSPENWLAEQIEEVEFEQSTRWSLRDESRVRLGWGNGEISNWDLLAPQVRQDIVRGLVDAQAVWAEIDELSRRSHRLIEKFVVKDMKVTSRELRTEQGEAESLSVRLANHHLAYDDVVLNVQGARRDVAVGALRSWGYEEATQRISRRIEDLHRVMNTRVERFSRRYQVAVESILFLLGVLAVVDLGLATIGTAYSGSVDSAPGAGSGLGFFAWLRHSNADTMMVVAIGIALALWMFAEVRRRR